jgi:hypothetical protein
MSRAGLTDIFIKAKAQNQPDTLENYLSLTYPLAERTVGNRALS